MTPEIKEIIDNILELVEDKQYPARRNITDYVVKLLPNDMQQAVSVYITDYYDMVDKRIQQK